MDIERIWQQYSCSLEALLRSRISNLADVEDLLQEILIKTYKNIGTLKSREKLKPWLFQLANNTILDFYRKHRGSRAVEAEDLWYGDSEALAQQHLSECILPFIDALPPETSSLLKAIDIEGQSQKRYAAEAGISYSTLKSRVQRGRAQLRKLFEECCHLEFDRLGSIAGYQAKPDQCGKC